MKNSFKQLFRTPGKTILFFLLMLAVTLLLVFSTSLLSETTQRIDEVERGFTTIGTVEQQPVAEHIPYYWDNICWGTQRGWNNLWDEKVTVDMLDYSESAFEYAPEFRPYFLTEQPEWSHTVSFDPYDAQFQHIIEFTPLEDSDEAGAAICRVEKVLLQQRNVGDEEGRFPPSEGMEIFICQCGGTKQNVHGQMIPLEAGKRYIATIQLSFRCHFHDYTEPADDTAWGDHTEYTIGVAPYSSQMNSNGKEIKTTYFPVLEDGTQNRYRIEEVTEDFYDEGGRGRDWEKWAGFLNHNSKFFAVMPTNSLQLLPLFHDNQAFLSEGKAISQEEFDNGALACMVPKDMMQKNGWSIGEKVNLSLKYSLYGPNCDKHTPTTSDTNVYPYFTYNFSPLNADGREYNSFWEAEYEIVGTYDLLSSGNAYGEGDIYADTILIPKASVQASDADNIAYYNYLDGKTATFQIPNGTIDDFDAALRAAVPEAESLLITYNDNGYNEIMESLQSTRTAALLLFVVGLLAAVVIILLLLYFFIVRERKRTAIERSLGMSKAQCRVSLLAGVLAVTILAACIGTAGGAVMMNLHHENAAQETASEDYNPAYSLWMKSKTAQEDMTKDFRAPAYYYALVPLALVGLVGILSVFMVNRNLKVEPIYLLSGKME